MRLDHDLLNIREQDGLRLIIPSHNGAVANAPWQRDNLIYRSRVETLHGQTVSQGFKKFFNLGHGPLDLQITVDDVVRACDRGDAVATLKLDGSLLIRSEWQDKLILRTRGSFGYEHLDNASEMELFKRKYPGLFQLRKFNHLSLLLEWTTPNNTIVLKYPEPELTLIGAVRHSDLSYAPIRHLEMLAKWAGVPLVKHFTLDAGGWRELQETLDSKKDIEGYVIRINYEQDLVKVKCAPYLTKHALKSTLSSEKLADMYFELGRPTFTEFCSAFKDAFDEEVCMWALGAISNLYEGTKILAAIEQHMRKLAAERKDWTRKDAAMRGIQEYGTTKRFAAYMNLWEGKPIKPELLKSILLQNTKQVEIGMFKNTEVVE